MFKRATVRVLPVVNRYGEHAPMVGVCCNACRTCTTTNVIGLAFAAAGAVALNARRITRRFSAKPF